jgi:hypothetical protein
MTDIIIAQLELSLINNNCLFSLQVRKTKAKEEEKKI